MEEENLFQILLDAGFTKVETPITKFQSFKNRFYKNPKYLPKVHDYWLQKNIDGDLYEVFDIDIWYIRLTKNKECLFDERRFKNEELLKLIPGFEILK